MTRTENEPWLESGGTAANDTYYRARCRIIYLIIVRFQKVVPCTSFILKNESDLFFSGLAQETFFFGLAQDTYADPVSTEFSANNESTAVEHIIKSHYTLVGVINTR